MNEGYDYITSFEYKNVSMIYVSSSVSGARKTAVKKFVNSSGQLVEDLGGNQRGYEIQGMIALLSGDEPESIVSTLPYTQKRDSIIEVLESKGPGNLVHPMYGVIENAVVTSYSLNESISELGIGQISVTFAISNTDGAPVEEEITLAQISESNQNVLAKVSDSIAETWLADVGLLGVYESAKEKAEEFSDTVSNVMDYADKAADSIEEVNSMVANLQSNIISLASAPQNFAREFVNVFNTINGTLATVGSVIDVYEGFFGFGFLTDVELSFDTVANNSIKSNNSVLNNAVASASIAGSYLASAQIDYATVSDIDAEVERLNDQLETFIDGDIDPEIKGELLSAKDFYNKIMSDKKQTTSRVIEVETNSIGARALSYMYYGNDSNYIEISEINGGNGIYLGGVVKVFSE